RAERIAVYARVSPRHKLRIVRALKRRGHVVAMTGDGINDAPAIKEADIGVAMGALGSDAAIEAADVVLMEDSPARLATALEIARRTRRIVTENIVLALGIKAFFFALGILGLAGIWEAVFADVGVTVLAVLNATRTLRYRPRSPS
ncbi:MAG: HAD-IC family P-type ATPase, partial [Desulfofundulus sp.]